MNRQNLKRVNEIVSHIEGKEQFLKELESDQLTIGIFEKDAPSNRIQLIGVPDNYEHPLQPLAAKFIKSVVEKVKSDIYSLEYELSQL